MPRHQVRAGAALALKPRHAVLEHAAREELPLDGLRQAGAGAGLRHRAPEGLQVQGDDLVEHGVLGVSRAIHGRDTAHASGSRARAALPMPRDGYAGSAPAGTMTPPLEPPAGARAGSSSAPLGRAHPRSLGCAPGAWRLAGRRATIRARRGARGITAARASAAAAMTGPAISARPRLIPAGVGGAAIRVHPTPSGVRLGQGGRRSAARRSEGRGAPRVRADGDDSQPPSRRVRDPAGPQYRGRRPLHRILRESPRRAVDRHVQSRDARGEPPGRGRRLGQRVPGA